jgi:uncharacterized membrane protein
MIRKIWKDPVWSAVIAAGLFAVISSASSLFIFGWTKSVRLVIGLWNWIISCSYIPNYVTLFGGITSLIVVIIIILKQYKHYIVKDKYTKDNIYNVVWRWNYGPGGEIYDLKSYCPKCDYEIHPVNIGPYAIIKHYALGCDLCKVKLHDFNTGDDISNIESKLIRLIEKNIRDRSNK